MTPFMDKIEAKLESMQIKLERMQSEHRLDYEQLRRDVASGFVSRDVLEPQLAHLRAEIQRIERDLSRAVEQLRKDEDKYHERIDEELRDRDQQEMSATERFWLRLGTVGGLIGILIATLTFFLAHPIR
jgi:septal ring factor EnvC (AmiA/AmiB activator)